MPLGLSLQDSGKTVMRRTNETKSAQKIKKAGGRDMKKGL